MDAEVDAAKNEEAFAELLVFR